jgi:hypothetical protein
MKLFYKITPCLLMLALAPATFAQSNGVPGPSDYEAFSRFIANRNIFDPNRVPHSTYARRPRIRERSASVPFLSLVGLMSYNKGTFAFFNAADSDLRSVLSVNGKIAGYTLTEMTTSQVKLVSDDKKQTLDLKVGDVLRQENGKWMLSDPSDVPVETTPAAPAASNAESAPADTSATPNSANEPNAILKRLMELRQKENQ